nr:14796_t:CDS:2 [Entrophospora candida]
MKEISQRIYISNNRIPLEPTEERFRIAESVKNSSTPTILPENPNRIDENTLHLKSSIAHINFPIPIVVEETKKKKSKSARIPDSPSGNNGSTEKHFSPKQLLQLFHKPHDELPSDEEDILMKRWKLRGKLEEIDDNIDKAPKEEEQESWNSVIETRSRHLFREMGPEDLRFTAEFREGARIETLTDL